MKLMSAKHYLNAASVNLDAAESYCELSGIDTKCIIDAQQSVELALLLVNRKIDAEVGTITADDFVGDMIRNRG